MSEIPPDIKEVLRKLRGRYLYPIVRERSDQEPPFIKITDGIQTNLKIERGDGPFSWQVSGKIEGRGVSFTASDSGDLVRKIDDRLAKAGVLAKHLGIEEIV
jgi:hypothetical protein